MIPEILSGIWGKTLGTPIAIVVRNKDTRPQDYDEMAQKYRPSKMLPTMQNMVYATTRVGDDHQHEKQLDE